MFTAVFAISNPTSTFKNCYVLIRLHEFYISLQRSCRHWTNYNEELLCCPERLWNLCLLRYLRPVWMPTCAIYCREPALAGWLDLKTLEIHSNPYSFVILWNNVVLRWWNQKRFVASHIYAHNGDFVCSTLFFHSPVGFMCMLLVLVLIPAVQKLITRSALLVFPVGLIPALGKIEKSFDAWCCWYIGHLLSALSFAVQCLEATH